MLVDPERYGFVLDELREAAGELGLDTRRELAAEAFAHTAGYDIAIANWFSDTESFPDAALSELVKVTDLPYGENPHQRAAYYMEAGRAATCSRWSTQHGGKPLSFNNLLDLDAATTLVREFTVPACVIVKHGNPCGVALAATLEEAYRKALAADPVSAFGGVVAVNRPLTRELAELLAEQFVEVLHAPGYATGAVDLLRERLRRTCACSRSDERRAAHAGRARLPPRARRPPGPGPRHGVRGPRDDGGRRRARRRPSASGATCCSPGASSSTCARTRS